MEPGFKVRGDQDILNDAKVNLEILKDDGMQITTIFYKGEEYPADNEGALRYNIYFSYRDSVFHTIKVDNLHGKVKGVPLNDIYFKNKEGNIIVTYVPFEGSESNEGFIMQRAGTFFTGNEPEIEKLKKKFTDLYKTK